MSAKEVYGLLTVVNLARAIDPGVAMPYYREFRRMLKQLASTHSIRMHRVHEKIVVAIPQPPEAAQHALRVIGPALMLDMPVHVTMRPKGVVIERLIFPTCLELRPEGWWLVYDDGESGEPDRVAIEHIIAANTKGVARDHGEEGTASA
jgi:hypothetical protein